MIKKILVVFGIVALVIIGSYIYIHIKLDLTKEAVEDYLVYEKGISKNDILECKPYYDLLKARNGSKWFVRVKLRTDKGTYFYYKNYELNKIILKKYTLNGIGYYGEDEYIKLKGKKP